MRYLREPCGVLAALLLAGIVCAQTIKLPARVFGEPGDFVEVSAETDGKTVRWMSLDRGLRVFPASLLRDTKTTVVIALVPGEYRLMAWTAKGDVPSEGVICFVAVGTPGPVPPPIPPTPVPPVPPPVPTDPLYPLLKAAWDKSQDPQRAAHRDKLAALYVQAAKDTVYLAELRTVGDLHAVMRRASQTLLADDALVKVREIVAAELRAMLPVQPDAPLDAGTRAACAKQFQRIADLLRALP